MRGHTLRAGALAALTANAVRPLNVGWTGFPAFAAGWLTTELAPQLLLGSLTDTVVAAARRRVTPTGLALAAASAAGLGYVSWRAIGTTATFGEVLGEAAAALDPTPDHEAGSERAERTSLRTLARPFAMAVRRVEVIRDVPYTKGGVKARLDVYRPREVPDSWATGGERGGAPVLVQIHGGGWTTGSKEQQGLLLMNRMAARGWVCVAVNYRLAPKYRWPTQIDDVRNALAWVHDHIGEYGGDVGHLILTGGSAGGHLAALAALTSEAPIAGCVPFYGVYDMAGDDPYTVRLRRFLRFRVFPHDATTEDFRDASPIEHITPDAPDFLVVHGTNDTMVSVSQARAFVARLREVSNGSVTFVELRGAQHAFEFFGSIRAHATITAVQQWLEWHRAQQRDATPAEPIG